MLAIDHHEHIWDAFQDSREHGHVANVTILEAVPQGVRPTTLEHCIGSADSAAVLRPIAHRPGLTWLNELD